MRILFDLFSYQARTKLPHRRERNGFLLITLLLLFGLFGKFCPCSLFLTLRKMSNVNQSDYLFSLSPQRVLGAFLLGSLSTLEEIVSTGRSTDSYFATLLHIPTSRIGGSFFWKTPDERFLIKSLPQEEANFLLRNLASYYRHLFSFRDTFLARFFGLYTVKNMKGDVTLRFVVMENLFCSTLKLHESYDLKGSSVNR